MKQRPKKPVMVQPDPMKFISVRNPESEHRNLRSKLVSMWKRNQDRSCYIPHQSKREKERRKRQLLKRENNDQVQ